MPRLIEYISVGFCSGYGDGDYRVFGTVGDLDRKALNELKLAMLGAIRCAEDTWQAAQANKPENMAYLQLSSGRNLADATQNQNPKDQT